MALGVLIGSAAVACGAVLTGLAPKDDSHGGLCDAYGSFSAALGAASEPDHVALRRLAAGLSRQAMAASQPQIGGQDVVSTRVAGESIATVLETSYGSRRDLFVAARPIAVACGQDWRTGSTYVYDLVERLSR